MKKIICVLILLNSLSSFSSTLISTHIQKTLDIEVKKNIDFQIFIEDLNNKYDCHKSGDLVINCEISLKVGSKNIMLLNYQYSHSPYTLEQTYRSFHFLFNQGTAPYNEVVFIVDYKVRTTRDESNSKEFVQAEVVSFSEL